MVPTASSNRRSYPLHKQTGHTSKYVMKVTEIRQQQTATNNKYANQNSVAAITFYYKILLTFILF